MLAASKSGKYLANREVTAGLLSRMAVLLLDTPREPVLRIADP